MEWQQLNLLDTRNSPTLRLDYMACAEPLMSSL